MSRYAFASLLGILAVINPTFAASPPVELEVSATEGWQSTGVEVTSGTRYGVLQTSGTWTVDFRNFSYVDGAGYSADTDAQILQGCKENSSWPYGLLLGRIGDSVYPIGRGTSFVAKQDGLLELSIHDVCLEDNAGSLNVKIQKNLGIRRVLSGLADYIAGNLTPSEAAQLGKLGINIAACSAIPDPVHNPSCLGLVIGLLNFQVQKVE